MKLSQQILAVALCLVVVLREGLGQSAADAGGSLKCYDCTNYKPDDNCDDPSEEKTNFVTCEKNQTMCRKVEQHIHFNGDDHIRVIRQCATTGDVGSCLERTGTYKFKSWYCQCKGDFCNSAGSLALSASLIGAVLLFALRQLL